MKKSERLGAFTISPRGEFRACSPATITMEYTVGDAPMSAGSSLKIGLPNMGWSEPLTPYPRGDWEIYKGQDRQICRYKRCNTTCRIQSDSETQFYMYSRGSQNFIGPYQNWSWWITVILEDGKLQSGDKIIITYGDTSCWVEGIHVQPWQEKDRIWFTCFVDPGGTGEYGQVTGSPVECRVLPGDFAKAKLTVPSVIKSGEDFRLKLSLTDWGEDPLPPAESEKIEKVELDRITDDGPERVEEVDSSQSSISVPNPFRAKNEGGKDELYRTGQTVRYRIQAESEDRTVTSESNPVLCSDAMPRLFWGDLHCHSFYHQYNEELGYGDPCTSPAELFAYARDTAHLDFIALTDGRGALPDNKGWLESQQAVIDNYRSGKFVTLKGWEVQMGTHGHRNAIYRGTEIEDRYQHEAFKEATVWMEAGSSGMRGVLDFYQGRNDVILIPHHPLVWMDWDVYEPNIDRLVEVYSCWGSSEYPDNDYWDKASPTGQSVVEALNRGCRVGFVGGSDSHTGYPGRSIQDADRYKFCRYKAGFTGVYAEKLERESIFDALKNRFCYATTGARMIVWFQVDGTRMGSVIPTEKGRSSHTIEFSVSGTDRISLIEVIRDGKTVHSIDPFRYDYQGGWTDDSDKAPAASYYYLRVTQADGNRAWASPVWSLMEGNYDV
jgi:hypothetical protein